MYAIRSYYDDVISNYSNIKQQENSDLFIALTHLGYECNCNALTDSQIARNNFV